MAGDRRTSQQSEERKERKKKKKKKKKKMKTKTNKTEGRDTEGSGHDSNPGTGSTTDRRRGPPPAIPAPQSYTSSSFLQGSRCSPALMEYVKRAYPVSLL